MTAPTPRPGILAIEPYVGGKSTLAGHTKVIKLASNESALGPSPRAVEALRKAAETMHRYPDGGSIDLRAAIAKRFGLDVNRIVCGTGSDELISLLCRAYAGPGDEVLYSKFGFLMYPIAALSVGATPVAAAEKNYRMDVDALLALSTPRTKLCFVANPNNPTGTYITAAELKRLRDGLPAGCVLVVDAAYSEYVTRNDYSSGLEFVDSRDDTVMLRTFSKMFALGGLRIGWGYFPPVIADVLNRIRGVFNITGPAQAAGVASLEDLAFQDQSRAHNDMWLPWFTEQLRALGLDVTPSVGNFVMIGFPAEGTKTAAAANAFLNSRGIIPRALANYHLPNHLRITIGLEAELRAVVSALADFLK
jgi:histidinol-phosphate aminotransferase